MKHAAAFEREHYEYVQELEGQLPYALVHEDCLTWMAQREPDSTHAIVTDAPFSVKDYSEASRRSVVLDAEAHGGSRPR